MISQIMINNDFYIFLNLLISILFQIFKSLVLDFKIINYDINCVRKIN